MHIGIPDLGVGLKRSWQNSQIGGTRPNLEARLLIVDDELSTRTLLSQIFGCLGHFVRVAEDGFSVLERIREEEPDVLLSDLNMPGMSGFELLSVVRRKHPRIYVIATSGAFSSDRVPNGIAADAFHEKATGLDGLFQLMKTAAKLEKHVRSRIGPNSVIASMDLCRIQREAATAAAPSASASTRCRR